ncbi:hypothetical protein MMC11_000491 [Xylographa trunciseda]|nr:hypothetical protein [Xylographa trunciseda]
MSQRAPKRKLNNNDDDDYYENTAELRVNGVLSKTYIDLHRRTINRINFNAQNPGKELSAIVLPMDFVRARHGFTDGLPDKVKRALELQRRHDNDPDSNGTSSSDRKLRRTMLRWHVIADYSIMMLSMLAFSGYFRSMVEQGSEDMWVLIWAKVQENHESIEYFAKARGLQWKDLLERYHAFAVFINNVQPLGEKFPGDEVTIEHPHSKVIPPSGGSLRVPTSIQAPETAQTVTDHVIYDEELWRDPLYPRPPTWPGVWPYPFNPMTRIPLIDYEENCDCCGSDMICGCQVTDFKKYSEPLVELRDYEGRGIGVRTLQFIEKGTILAEYLGEIVPNGYAYGEPWNLDSVYGWEIEVKIPNGPQRNPLATIAAKDKGNWCRYTNHSCRQSLSGDVAIVGTQRCLLYWAIRDILPFEELTVNYGDAYFRPSINPCRCGEDVCRFSAQDVEEESDTDRGEDDKEDSTTKEVVEDE